MVTAFARTPLQFGLCRALLGLGEAGNFPAAIKSVAEWFPKKERALATGIFNAGTNVGAVIAPPTVAWIFVQFGWQWAFILTGAIGLVWLAFWLPLYRKPDEHPKVSPAELAYIQSDPPDPPAKTPWLKLIPHRQAAAFAIAKYMTDPIWWFYLFWTPKFLSEKHHLDLSSLPLPLIVIYLIADVGSVGGGWLSSSLIKRGWTVNKARKTAMLICALAGDPGRFRLLDRESLAGGLVDRTGRGGSSGLVGQRLQHRLGHVPATGGRFGRRHRWHGGVGGRDHVGGPDRRGPSDEPRRLHGQLRHRRFDVPDRSGRGAPPGAEARGGGPRSARPADVVGAGGRIRVHRIGVRDVHRMGSWA